MIVAPTCDLISSPITGRPFFSKRAAPVFFAGDEDRNAIDKPAAGFQHLLDIPLGGFFGADRKIIHDDIGSGVFQQLGDINGITRGFFDNLREIIAEPVVGHAAHDFDTGLGDGGKLEGVVRLGEDGIGEILADFVLVDINGGRRIRYREI